MKQVIVVSAIAGLASIAAAQNFSFTLVPSVTTIDTSGGNTTFTMTLIGGADVGTHLMGGGLGGLSSDGASDAVLDMTWTPESWSVFNTDGGYAGNGNYNSFIFGWLYTGCPICEPPPATMLDAVIGSFEVTVDADSVGQLGFSMFTDQSLILALQTMNFDTGSLYDDSDGTLSLEGATVNLVPSPGAYALISPLGLIASRRRR